jgi:hypothetical protein
LAGAAQRVLFALTLRAARFIEIRLTENRHIDPIAGPEELALDAKLRAWSLKSPNPLQKLMRISGIEDLPSSAVIYHCSP